jgi:hypothetical protein
MRRLLGTEKDNEDVTENGLGTWRFGGRSQKRGSAGRGETASSGPARRRRGPKALPFGREKRGENRREERITGAE